MKLKEVYYHDDGFLYLEGESYTVHVHRLPSSFCVSVGSCRDFVYRHRNIFDSLTLVHLVSKKPIAFYEVGISPCGTHKNFWIWVFDSGIYYVVKFHGKPSKNEIIEAVNLVKFERGR
ncbi:MAG: hypothetical protein ACTSR2_00100 [Candidatus Hodarchaeales archaeon]